MITQWVLYIFMQGHIIALDQFRSEQHCLQTIEKIKTKFEEHNVKLIWCESNIKQNIS